MALLDKLKRSPEAESIDAALARRDPRHLDDSSPYYVPDELRADFLVLVSDRRSIRRAEDTVRELGAGATPWDASGRLGSLKVPAPFDERVHADLVDSARNRWQRAEVQREQAAQRRAMNEVATRCALCGEHGADSGHRTAHFLVSVEGGACEPRGDVEGVAVRLHAECAAAVNEAARRRVDAAAVARADSWLDAL